MHRSTALLLALLAGAAPLACDDGAPPAPPPVASQPRPLAAAPRPYDDPAQGLRFETGAGVQVAAERFAEQDPGTIRAIYTLSGPLGVLLTVDLWDNRARLPLERWFERYLRFMRDQHAATQWRPMTRHQALGLLLERPRTPQAYGQRIAVVAADGRVLRVICYRSDDPVAVEVFDRVLASLQLRGGVR